MYSVYSWHSVHFAIPTTTPVYPHLTPPPIPTPHSDLSTHTALLDVIIGAFSSPTEGIRAAASYALGSVSAGNLQLYLPVILQEIEAKPRRHAVPPAALAQGGKGEEGGGGGEKEEEGEREREEFVRYDLIRKNKNEVHFAHS